MRATDIYKSFETARQREEKKFAVLVDPDKLTFEQLRETVQLSTVAGVDYFFVGGSLMMTNHLDAFVKSVKQHSDIPVVLFPGSTNQISKFADAIFLLSLISGRNAELLIGKHVEAAPALKASNIEILPTGYMLIDGGMPTTVSYISNTQPIPADKPDIASCTAMAGEMLGLKMLYLDSGSGAKNPISKDIIQQVRRHTQIPLIIGGGITTPQKALSNCKAGADVIVVGNAIEKDPALIKNMAEAIHSCKITSST